MGVLLAPPDYSRKHGRGGAELGSSPAFPGRLCQTRGVPRGHSGPQGGLRAGVAAGRSLETLRKRGRAAEGVLPWSVVARGQDTQVGARDRVGGSRGPGRGRAWVRLMGLPPPPLPAPVSRHLCAPVPPPPWEACGQGSAGAWAHILTATGASAPNPVSMSHATPTPHLKPRGRAPGSGGEMVWNLGKSWAPP